MSHFQRFFRPIKVVATQGWFWYNFSPSENPRIAQIEKKFSSSARVQTILKKMLIYILIDTFVVLDNMVKNFTGCILNQRR